MKHCPPAERSSTLASENVYAPALSGRDATNSQAIMETIRIRVKLWFGRFQIERVTKWR
jgi:hypothetical protein